MPPPRMNQPGVRVSQTRSELPQLPFPSTAIQTMPQAPATTPTASNPTPVQRRHERLADEVPGTAGLEVPNGTTGAGGGGSGAKGSSAAVTINWEPPLAGRVWTNGLCPGLSTFTVTVPSFTRGMMGSGIRPTTLSSTVTTAPVVP